MWSAHAGLCLRRVTGNQPASPAPAHWPRSADARVHERCRLLGLPKDAFEDLLFLHKDLAYEVLWSVIRMLTGRLRETNDKLTFLTVTGKF